MTKIILTCKQPTEPGLYLTQLLQFPPELAYVNRGKTNKHFFHFTLGRGQITESFMLNPGDDHRKWSDRLEINSKAEDGLTDLELLRVISAQVSQSIDSVHNDSVSDDLRDVLDILTEIIWRLREENQNADR